MSVSLEDELAAFEAEIAGLGADEEEDKEQPQQSEQQHTSSRPTRSSTTSAAVTQTAPAPASGVSAISQSTAPQSASLPSPSSSLSSVSHTPAPPQAATAAASTSAVHVTKRARDEQTDSDRPTSPHKRPHIISAKPAVISAPPNARNATIPTPTPAAGSAPIAASNPAPPRPATTTHSPLPTLPTPPNPTPSLITPPAATTATTQPPTAATTNPPHTKHNKQKLDPALVRSAAGSVWVDQTLTDFPPNDFRLFIGDLGIEVNDQLLSKTFAHYTSFCYARVIRDKKTALSKGFGFVSFLDHEEGLRALKEMQGKYCGNRPMKLKKGQWQKRSLETQKTRNKHLF